MYGNHAASLRPSHHAVVTTHTRTLEFVMSVSGMISCSAASLLASLGIACVCVRITVGLDNGNNKAAVAIRTSICINSSELKIKTANRPLSLIITRGLLNVTSTHPKERRTKERQYEQYSYRVAVSQFRPLATILLPSLQPLLLLPGLACMSSSPECLRQNTSYNTRSFFNDVTFAPTRVRERVSEPQPQPGARGSAGA